MTHHLLHEPKPVRFLRVEHVSGEDVPHRVPPADRARHSDGGAAERQDGAAHLDLPEAGAVGGDHYVAREHQLDAEGQTGALHRQDDRLGEVSAAHLPRVDAAFRH